MPENRNVKIYIGFDQRESVAFHTFVQSLIDHASIPLDITPLAVKTLKGYEEKHTIFDVENAGYTTCVFQSIF